MKKLSLEEKKRKRNKRGFFVDPVFLSLLGGGAICLLTAAIFFALFQLVGFNNRELGSVFTTVYVATSVAGYLLLLFAFLYLFIRKGLGYEATLTNGYRPKAKGRCEKCFRPLPLGAVYCPRCGKKAKEDLSNDRKAEVVDELIMKKSNLPHYSFYLKRGLYLYRPYILVIIALILFFAFLMFIDINTADGIDPELVLIIVLITFLAVLIFVFPLFTKSHILSHYKEASYEIRQNGIEVHEVYLKRKHYVTLEVFIRYDECFASRETEEGYLLFTHIGGRRYAVALPIKGIAFSSVSFIKAKAFLVKRRKD